LDWDTFKYIAEKGRVSLFLDGFDEIPSDAASRIFEEVEDLVNTFSEMTVIASSRPNTDISHSPSFSVYPLCHLDGNDLPHILHKIINDRERERQLIEAVKDSPTGVDELITTPLLVTLLVYSYNETNTIPSHLVEFYRALFPLLFYRHDKTKPNFKRSRSTNLTEREMASVFDVLCFLTSKREELTLDRTALLDEVDKAIKISEQNSSPETFVRDIVDVTCLLVEEGLSYSFIHKSVQEFFAARFVANRGESAVEFYRTLLSSNQYPKWSGHISFLEELDPYRVRRYYLIPEKERVLSGLCEGGDPLGRVDRNAAEELLRSISLTFKDGQLRAVFAAFSDDGPTSQTFFIRAVGRGVRTIFEAEKQSERRFRTGKASVAELLNDIDSLDDVIRSVEDAVKSEQTLLIRQRDYLKREDDLVSEMTLV